MSFYINCKLMFFSCMDSQMFLQIFVIWENIWTLSAWLLNCMYYQMSLQIFFVRKFLDIGYKVKVYHLNVFSNVSSNIHYLKISSYTECKGMVLKGVFKYILSIENLESLIAKVLIFIPMCSLMFLQVSML